MPAITLTVNGKEHKTECVSGESLLSVLRNRLGLTGTKYGCGEGQCGACTVLLRGKSIRSCRAPAESISGPIVTIEGLAAGGKLHPLQQAFLDNFAFQCGFCTPGMILAAKALLDENPRPTHDEIIAHMDGNLCRCTGYLAIVKSIQQVATGAASNGHGDAEGNR